jgi:hypothetical protein
MLEVLCFFVVPLESAASVMVIGQLTAQAGREAQLGINAFDNTIGSIAPPAFA